MNQPQCWKDVRPEGLPCPSCKERDTTARAGDGHVHPSSKRAHGQVQAHPEMSTRKACGEFQEEKTKGYKMLLKEEKPRLETQCNITLET